MKDARTIVIKSSQGRRRDPSGVVGRGRKNVSVAEDWYPTTDGLISVTITRYIDGTASLSVWGGDDTYMQFGSPPARIELERARAIFDRINHLVTKDDLLSWGFHYG